MLFRSELLTEYTKSDSLLKHAMAVEASVRGYARRFGENEDDWGVTALLHDFDYEMHPTLDKHPQDGAPILREEGYPEVVITAVLSHAEHLAIPRETLLQDLDLPPGFLRVRSHAPLGTNRQASTQASSPRCMHRRWSMAAPSLKTSAAPSTRPSARAHIRLRER